MTIRMEERLWITARHLAKQAGMDYSVPCAAIVRDFIRAGTHNMIREKRTGDHDFEEADTNLEKLVRSMIDETRVMKNTRPALPGPLVIREGAFVHAKTICPLWPFC
jgi:hypothetical protein